MIVYFKPAPNVNYYSIEITPESNKNQIIITKIIESEPYQANLEDSQLIPGKSYKATISSYNQQGERSDKIMNFKMKDVPTPQLVKVGSGANWVKSEWEESSEIESYEVSLSRKSDDKLVLEKLDVIDNEFMFQGLVKDTEYVFTIRSVIRNIRSDAVIKMLTTNDYDESSGLLIGNSARTLAGSATTGSPPVTSYASTEFTQVTAQTFMENSNTFPNFEASDFENELENTKNNDNFENLENLGNGDKNFEKYQNTDAGISCLRTADNSEYKLLNLYFLVKELSQTELFDFDKLRTWMVEIITNLPTGARFIRVALATYSNDLKIEFLLDTYTDSNEISKHILNMQTRFKKPRDGRLGRAIFKTNDNILQPQFFKGDELTYIYIVTNSVSIDPVSEAVDQLKLSIFSPIVTIVFVEKVAGKLSDDEILMLEGVASVPQRVKIIRSYSAFKNFGPAPKFGHFCRF